MLPKGGAVEAPQDNIVIHVVSGVSEGYIMYQTISVPFLSNSINDVIVSFMCDTIKK